MYTRLQRYKWPESQDTWQWILSNTELAWLFWFVFLGIFLVVGCYSYSHSLHSLNFGSGVGILSLASTGCMAVGGKKVGDPYLLHPISAKLSPFLSSSPGVMNPKKGGLFFIGSTSSGSPLFHAIANAPLSLSRKLIKLDKIMYRDQLTTLFVASYCQWKESLTYLLVRLQTYKQNHKMPHTPAAL